MKPKNIPPLLEKNWQSITSDTLWKILSLLDASRTLISDIEEDENEVIMISVGGNPTVSAGLYTFAVEEYGKYLYLKSLKPIDEKYHIDYSNEFTNHRKKFGRALSNLPDACKLLNLGEKGDMGFYEPDFHDDIIANFETRLRIFYSDFDAYFANKIPKQEPPVNIKLLKIGIEKLYEIVNSENIKLMDKRNKNDS